MHICQGKNYREVSSYLNRQPVLGWSMIRPLSKEAQGQAKNLLYLSRSWLIQECVSPDCLHQTEVMTSAGHTVAAHRLQRHLLCHPSALWLFWVLGYSNPLPPFFLLLSTSPKPGHFKSEEQPGKISNSVSCERTIVIFFSLKDGVSIKNK